MVLKFGELFENVQQSKSILNKLNIPLDHEDYQVIRGMLERTPGWVGLFTKFHFADEVPLEELAVLLDTLQAKRSSLNRLPMPVDKYDSFEKLGDDLRDLEISQLANRLLKELNRTQQDEFKEQPPQVKERLTELAPIFYKMELPVQHKFLRKLKELTGAEFISRLETYVESNMSGFNLDIIKRTVQGVDDTVILYEDDERGFLIVEVKTYEATRALGGATNWCIVASSYTWARYAGLETNNRQFIVYNFNVKLSDSRSMLGVTIDRYGGVYAAHWKQDESAGYNMSSTFGTDWETIKMHLKPLTPEEIKHRAEMQQSLRVFVAYSTTQHLHSNSYRNLDECDTEIDHAFSVLDEKEPGAHNKRLFRAKQTLAGFVAEFSDDDELFLRRLRALRPLLDTRHGKRQVPADTQTASFASRLFKMNQYAEANAVIAATFDERHNDTGIKIDPDMYYEKLGEGLIKLNADDAVVQLLTAAPTADDDDDDDQPGISLATFRSNEGAALLVRILPKLEEAGFKFSDDHLFDTFQSVSSTGWYENEKMWRSLVTVTNRMTADPKAMGMSYLLMLHHFNIDRKTLNEVLTANNEKVSSSKDYTYFPEREQWQVYFDDFEDPYLGEFFKDEDIFKDNEDLADYLPDFDFSDFWYMLDAKSEAEIVKLLQARGWDVSNADDAKAVFESIQDGGDGYDDDDDEDEENDYDEDEDQGEDLDEEEESLTESKNVGNDLDDVLEAFKDAWRYGYEQDTSDELFEKKISALEDVFTMPADRKFFQTNPYNKKEMLTMFLPLSEVVDNLCDNIFDEVDGESLNFDPVGLVRVRRKEDSDLLDPDLDISYTCSDETLNSQLRENLPND